MALKCKFNIPNKITIIRAGLVPLFAVILWVDIPYKNYLAAFIFAMLSVSDFLDGYFARKKKQVTELGKIIDPISDKILISTALILLIGKGVDLWMAVVIIAREVLITAIRIYLLPSKIVVPASNFGKAKTVAQSIAILFVLLNIPFSRHILLVAVFLTVISGIEYLIRIKKMTGNRIVNLPNSITLIRFLLIIPFIQYFLSSKITASLLIFAVIALGDKLDGISARLTNQKTDLGSFFDSLTDWIFLTATFTLFVYNKNLSLLAGILLLILNIFAAIIKLYYLKKYKKILSSIMSKLTVGFSYVTVLAILIIFAYKDIFVVVLMAMLLSTVISFFIKAIIKPSSLP